MPTVVVLPLVPVTTSQSRPGRAAAVQPPGQLHLADHLDTGGARRGEQRRVGPDPRRGHDQLDAAWQFGQVAGEGHRRPQVGPPPAGRAGPN